MDKKLLIGLIVVIVILLGVWIFKLVKGPALPGVSPEAGEVPYRPREEVKVGYGWSVKDDVKEAVQEAVSSALRIFGEESPEYALLFTTVGYGPEKVYKEVRRLLPNTKLHGGTSHLGVMTRDGFHIGEIGSLAILLASSPKIDFGVGGADIDKFLSAKEAGKEAILRAIKNAGREGEKPKLVFMTGSFANEEAILAGIEEVLGSEIPVVGGTAFDEDGTGQWREFVNESVYTNGMALTAFFTDLRVGWALEAGYEMTENKGIVTKAEGRTVYEIDHRPALDVYNEWTGGLVDEIAEGVEEKIFIETEKTSLYVLAKIVTGKHMGTHYLSIHAFMFDTEEKSLTGAATLEEGDEVLLMRGTWETNLDHCRTTPAKGLASEDIKKGQGYFAMYNYCVGKMGTIPPEERPKMSALVDNTLGGVPFIGAFTGGEQGWLEGVGNRHVNLANNIVIFAPAD